YVDANQAFTQMTGYQLAELKTMSCLEITYKEDRERYKAMLNDLLAGKIEHFEMEKRYIRKDGTLIWARLNGSIVDPEGSKLWVMMAEDITERKRLSDELRQERDRLRALLDLSHRFISNLDLRELFDGLVDGVRRLGP